MNLTGVLRLERKYGNIQAETGVVLTEYIKCLDVMRRNAEFVEKISKDILEKIIILD
jgi:hypothetical protein